MRLDRSFRGHITTHEYSIPAGQEQRLIIGRPRQGEPLPDLDLSPDFTASRPHAALHVEEGGEYFLEDLNSTHGTQLNGVEIRGQGRVPVCAGDLIRMGDTMLRVGAAFDVNAPQLGFFERAASGESTPFDLKIGGKLDAGAPLPSLVIVPQSQSTRDAAGAARLAAVYDLPLQFAAQTRLADLLQLIVVRLVEMIPGATRGALVLGARGADSFSRIPGGGVCDLSEVSELEGLVPQAYFPLDGPPIVSRMLARRAMSERSGFIWQRGEDEESTPVSGSIVRYGIESGMYAPLLWQDSALGAVCVDNGAGHAAFSQDDLRLMLMVGQYAAMAVANQQLQEEMREAWTGALEALTSALASRDYDTQSHCYRTVELTVALARILGVSEDELPAIARGALLHDIGKIGVSDNILLKPGPLTGEEREVMKGHARLGHEMLHHIPFFHDALPIVLHHHEQYDGSGYPMGLKEKQIPRGARIFHVVDLYDALTQARPYKSAWTHEAAIAEIKRLSGHQCDPEVALALEKLDPEITARIRRTHDFSPDVRELLGRQSN
jgi:putative nucleotidyltransferase with HDIG domain